MFYTSVFKLLKRVLVSLNIMYGKEWFQAAFIIMCGCSHASICSYWIKTPCFCVVISLENDLETLRDALLKTRLDPTPSKTKSPGIDFFFPTVCIKTAQDIFNYFSIFQYV